MTLNDLKANAEHLLKRKKDNDSKTTEEERRGKYKKSYERQLSECRDALMKLYIAHFTLCFRFREKDAQCAVQFYHRVCEIMTREMKELALKALEKSIEEYDLYAGLAMLEPVYQMMEKEYMPYWCSMCRPVTVPGYTHYNLITGMWYNPEFEQWAVRNEDGTMSYSSEYPPDFGMQDGFMPNSNEA